MYFSRRASLDTIWPLRFDPVCAVNNRPALCGRAYKQPVLLATGTDINGTDIELRIISRGENLESGCLVASLLRRPLRCPTWVFEATMVFGRYCQHPGPFLLDWEPVYLLLRKKDCWYKKDRRILSVFVTVTRPDTIGVG